MLCLLDDLFYLGDAPSLGLGEEALELRALGFAVLFQAQGNLDCTLPLVFAGLLALVQLLTESGDFRAQEKLTRLLVRERTPERGPSSLKRVHRNVVVLSESLT